MSWLNMVERFFRNVPELVAAIGEYIAVHNQNPKPFVWTATANDILQKVIRANRRIGSKENEALQNTLDGLRESVAKSPQPMRI